MKELIKLNKNIEFEENISEITSISLESVYNASEFGIEGNFILTGTYKDIFEENDKSFEQHIPFTYDFLIDIDLESININIEDFTYDIDKNILNIYVSYEVSFNKIINERIEEEILEPEEKIEEKDEIRDEGLTVQESTEKFITYKIHIVKEEETYNSISTIYNVNAEDIKSLNEIDELFPGLKLLIPIYNE